MPQDEWIQVRVSAELKEQARKDAENAGLTLSEYIKYLLTHNQG